MRLDVRLYMANPLQSRLTSTGSSRTKGNWRNRSRSCDRKTSFDEGQLQVSKMWPDTVTRYFRELSSVFWEDLRGIFLLWIGARLLIEECSIMTPDISNRGIIGAQPSSVPCYKFSTGITHLFNCLTLYNISYLPNLSWAFTHHPIPYKQYEPRIPAPSSVRPGFSTQVH